MGEPTRHNDGDVARSTVGNSGFSSDMAPRSPLTDISPPQSPCIPDSKKRRKSAPELLLYSARDTADMHIQRKMQNQEYELSKAEDLASSQPIQMPISPPLTEDNSLLLDSLED